MDEGLETLNDEFEDVFRPDHELKTFPLLELPMEIVLSIIEMAVTRPDPIDPTHGRKRRDQVNIVREPPLALTSKFFRREVHLAFYRNNIFESRHLNNVPCTRDWLVAIGHERRMLMGTFTFHAKFSDSFWQEKFAQIGISTKIEAAEDQSRAEVALTGFQTLTVTFL
ncbi:hypothetical protein LTR09_000693 [Extremus antarcticus]|uniref:F-box domain-containing protein n=1 Tax=Extremus antarcticus TaxID=702011 RepID=A0AAJ0LXK0_9PEZI|nr:hypothetical protein LTR09_000693 [Extremus antarcticus]